MWIMDEVAYADEEKMGGLHGKGINQASGAASTTAYPKSSQVPPIDQMFSKGAAQEGASKRTVFRQNAARLLSHVSHLQEPCQEQS